MKAVILAAGEGKRLRPLTHGKPKAMLPVGNLPILEYGIVALSECGINELILVVGYKNERIRDYFQDGKKWKVSITYVKQKKQLGTADALRYASGFVDESFLVMNGDSLIPSISIARLLKSKGTLRMMVVKRDETKGYGVVLARGSRVEKVVEKPLLPVSNLVNVGAYVFPPEIFEEVGLTELSPRGEYEITDTIQRMIEKGYDVRMVLASSQDVSYPWDLLRVNSSVLAQQKILREGKIESSVIKGKVSIGKNSIIRPGCCLFGPIRIGKNCEIGPNVVLLPSTSIGDNVTVSPFTQIRNSILMKGASIGPSSIITNSIIADDVEIGCNFISESRVAKVEVENELYSINFGCIIGESSLIGDGTLVKAGRMLGCRCKVGSGCTVSTNLPDNSILN